MKKLLFLLALLLASPAFAQFADQRQYAPTSGGSANIQTVAIPNYNLNVGVVVRFIPGFTNTGPMTLSVNGGVAKVVLKPTLSGLAALTGGEVQAGQASEVLYDGTRYELLNATAFVFGTGPLILTSTGSNIVLELNPEANSLGTGFDINMSPAGTIGVTYWNSINITSDTVPCLYCVDLNDIHILGGATVRGAKVGIVGFLTQTIVNSGTGTTAIVGLEGIGQSNVGDGGSGLTLSTAMGTYFGANLIGRNAGTNVFEVTAVEDDVMSAAGSSTYYSFGHAIADFAAVQGTSLDAGLVIYNGVESVASGYTWGPSNGFHMGISFAELGNEGQPIDDTGTLIGIHLETLSSLALSYGVDLRLGNFTNSAFASHLFSVSQAGYVFAIEYWANGSEGVTCATGSPTSSFAAVGGLVTHC